MRQRRWAWGVGAGDEAHLDLTRLAAASGGRCSGSVAFRSRGNEEDGHGRGRSWPEVVRSDTRVVLMGFGLERFQSRTCQMHILHTMCVLSRRGSAPTGDGFSASFHADPVLSK
jgi:hypothetical protein